jgi:hypothetical protein
MDKTRGRQARGYLIMKIMKYIYKSFSENEDLFNLYKTRPYCKFLNAIIRKTDELNDEIVYNIQFERVDRMNERVCNDLSNLNDKLRNLIES